MVFAEALQQNTMIVSRAVGSISESANVIIADTLIEMVNACSKMLQRNFDTTSIHPFNIDETVENYSQHYNL
jgi:hypothetical protein